MAHEVGAIYIDTYGTGKLKKELVNRDIVNSGCYILGAGGLSWPNRYSNELSGKEISEH